MEQKNRYLLVVVTIAVIALVTSFLAFNKAGLDNQTSQQINTLQKINKTGQIDVCYGVYPPAVIKDAKTGELSGHDIDAVELIAERIGATVEYHEQTFGNMAAALQSGICDLATTFFAQIPRAKVVAFTQPLYYAGHTALVQKGDTRFQKIEDADKKGIKVVVANGESGHNYVKAHFQNAEIIVIDVESSDLSRFLVDVSTGRADIGIADTNTIARYAEEHPEVEDLFTGKPFDLSPVNFAVRYSDADFLVFMNTSLEYLQISGEFRQLEEKYDAQWLHEIRQYSLN